MTYNNKVEYLIGNSKIKKKAIEPYNIDVCNFLIDLSKKLVSSKYSKDFSDIKALAFWCRKNEIFKFRDRFISNEFRLGLGLLFHITPSNIPTNFAYSLIFGLLTGNSNIVKVPSKDFKQIGIICSCINEILKKKYKKVREMISIVRYSDNDEFTKKISNQCNARLIWGGDKTISTIRSFPTDQKTLDITFPDRYSFCIINSDKLLDLSKKNIQILSERFYNDTYLVDQNACSSPHLICWIGKNTKKGKELFWQNVFQIVKKKYDLNEGAAIEKLTNLYGSVLSSAKIKNFKKFGNLIYILELKKLDQKNHEFRGKWGFFYEFEAINLNQIKNFINNRYQTLSYFGIEKKILKNFIFKNYLKGIDRIVPIGQTLDMNFFWDGYDINKILTRVIDIR